MGSIEWAQSLETGDELVDEQHRSIHALFDHLAAAEDSPSEVMGVLDRLMAHVDCHFATEERLMERSSYPAGEAEEHVAEHRKLTEGARDMVLRFRAGGITSTVPVTEFLGEWLSTHVHEWDRRLVDHVKARGHAASLPEPWASEPPSTNGSAA